LNDCHSGRTINVVVWANTLGAIVDAPNKIADSCMKRLLFTTPCVIVSSLEKLARF
jgi:hypothetical protein